MGHQRVIDTVRRTSRTLYVVGGFYVAIGFLVAVPSAVAGDRLSAFLGFLIISGALGFAAVLTLVLRLSVRVSAIGESIEDVSRRLERFEEAGLNSTGIAPADPDRPVAPVVQESRILDLSAIGSGDPSVLAAATLDRAGFPRLVAAMDEAPAPDGPALRDANPSGDSPEPRFDRGVTPTDEPADPSEPAGVADKNPLRVWKVAMREGDLATCREVWSTLVDTADPDLVAQMSSQLEALSLRMERSLRATFVQNVRRGNYREALEIGEQISRLFPDQTIAREFQEIEPHLRRRAQEDRDISRPPCGTGFQPVENRFHAVGDAP